MSSLRLGSKCRKVGLDIYWADIAVAVKSGIYDDCIVADANQLPVRNQSFDVVLCAEMVEHLSKRRGINLIMSLENLSRRCILLTMPIGEYPQEAVNGNLFQKHEASWSTAEVKSMGYKVTLVGMRKAGLKFAGMRMPLKALAENIVYPIVELLVYPLIKFSPDLARNMVCSKSVELAK